MPGIGKTTIANAIYAQIAPYFENMYFLNDIKNSSLFSLQQRLIFNIGKATERNISTTELKEIFRGKRVLIVLDNVSKLEQLNALCASREWFGEGSKIIITARDRHLLKEHGVGHIYKVKELDESESLVLFNSKAFRQATSQEDFAELSRQAVAYSRGLPLALKVIGSLLRERTISDSEFALHRIKMFPQHEVQSVLEDSFNDLNDEEKQIFLDIAYFFIGMNQNDVLQRYNRSTQRTTLQICRLEDKSFITIDENNKLQMHDLLQATAEDIIRRKSRIKTDQ
ncbi:NBS-LRR resistance protein, partial [Trifolium medium]|nr:NBS-LRR resistance protein [Trifolium medium]